MDEQLSLFGDLSGGGGGDAPLLPGFTDLAPELADEVAAGWGLPIGKKARVTLRGHQLEALAGWLQLEGLPNLPFDGREALRLRIGRDMFTSRQVAGWHLLE